ncbi:hypothetical protein AtNW77_Chr5g0126321 [Arabidopsis thaliana]
MHNISFKLLLLVDLFSSSSSDTILRLEMSVRQKKNAESTVNVMQRIET